MTLDETKEFVAERMAEIAACFVGDMKITVIARRPGFHDQDFLMTNDRLAELRQLVDRRAAAMETTGRPRSDGFPYS